MYKTLELDITDGIAAVSLNRPEKHNAINFDMFRELGEVGEHLKSINEVRAVILSGKGKSFCAGIDLSEMGKLTKDGSFDEMALTPLPSSESNFFQRAATIWYDIPVPVITSVHGICFGGGTQICLGSDIRVAHPDTRFSIMELKWGIIPDMGISTTLPRLTSYDKAMELTMTNREFLAKEAFDLGVVTKISNDPKKDSKAIAKNILNKSPDAIIQLKKLYKKAWSTERGQLLKLEANLQTTLMGGENQIEAISANFGQRDPHFKPVKSHIKN